MGSESGFSSSSSVTRLHQLKPGEQAVIVAVHGETRAVARIHSLGFLPGRRVAHSHTALFGDPVAYLVDGQKIAMRRQEAQYIEIQPIAEP